MLFTDSLVCRLATSLLQTESHALTHPEQRFSDTLAVVLLIS